MPDKPFEKKLEYLDTDLPLIFSDHLIVYATENEFILSFFQSRVRLFGPHDQLGEAADTVPAVCVARIVVTPASARNLHRLLDETFNKQADSTKTEPK